MRLPKVPAIVVLTCGAMAVSLELGIRLLNVVPDNAPITYVAIDGDEGYSPAPGAEGRSFFGVVHRINSLGLRDRERPVKKSPGAYRVLAVGDSVAYAHGVAQEQSYAAQLERLLQSRGRPYEVWNLGVEGYNLFNENARYARLAPTLQPDLVVIMVLFNDLLPGPAGLRVTSVGTLAAKGRVAPYPDSWRPYLESSALFTALIRVYSSFGRDRGSFDPWNFYPAMESQLDRFLATSEKAGAPVVLALMSGRSPSAEDYRALASRLAAYAERKGIAFIGFGAVLGEEGRAEFFLPGDSTHPNADGHLRIAEALESLIP
jgi:lysophospholipase L1-like esterase